VNQIFDFRINFGFDYLVLFLNTIYLNGGACCHVLHQLRLSVTFAFVFGSSFFVRRSIFLLQLLRFASASAAATSTESLKAFKDTNTALISKH
jgi:hypothetical protein